MAAKQVAKQQAPPTNGPHKPRKTSTGKSSPPYPAISPRLYSLVAILLIAAAVLYYRASHTPMPKERLFLSNSVVLGAPPPLPESDTDSVRLSILRYSQASQFASKGAHDGALQYSYGTAALAAGDTLTAVQALWKAEHLTAQPGADLYYQLARSFDKLGKCQLALIQCQLMIHAYSKDARGYLEEARTLDLQSRRTESVQALESGLAAIGQDDIPGRILLINQFDEYGATARGLKEAQELQSRFPANSQAVLWVVNFMIRSQQPAPARSLLVKLLSDEPKNAQAHFALGLVLSNPLLPDRDLAAAEDEMMQAIRIAPKEAGYYSRLAELYLNLGKYKQCAYAALQLLAISPDSAAGRLNLSVAYAHLGMTAESSTQSKLASLLLARDQERANIQIKVSEHASNPGPYLELARHYVRYQQMAYALPAYEAAFALSPNDATVRTELSDLCKQIGLQLPSPLPEYK